MRVVIPVLALLLYSAMAIADPWTDFEQARARWHSAGVAEYVFIYQEENTDVIAPYCAGALIRVHTVPGRDIQPVVVQGTRHCPKGTRGRSIGIDVPTSIDALFDRISRWLYDPPTKVDIEAIYDLHYGVPLRWKAVKPEITDSDEGFEVTKFQPNK